MAHVIWTPRDPQLAGAEYHNFAGLPQENLGTHISIGILVDTNGVVFGPAVPLDGNVGGWPQYVVPNPATQIQNIKSFEVNPSY